MNPFDITTEQPNLFPEDTRRMPKESEPQRPEVKELSAPEFVERTRRVHLLTQLAKKPKGQYARGLEGRPEDFA